MTTLQRTLIASVVIGEVFDDRSPIEDQISKLWTELWAIAEAASHRMPEWQSIEYYRNVLMETYQRSTQPGYWLEMDAVGSDRDQLTESLAELCPPGVYFGPDEHRPHLWGFYPEWRDEE